MRSRLQWSSLVLMVLMACASGAKPPVQQPTGPGAEPAAPAPSCDVKQGEISKEADQRAAPWGVQPHLAKNFPEHKISWLMPEGLYQKYVVGTNAKSFGRCADETCYLFAAPSQVIHKAVADAMVDGKHDPAAIGKALGLPAKNFEGQLRMMTFDMTAQPICVRLPVDADPGVWKCQTPEDTDCFKFGGYTSGGVPELMAIDVPVAATQVEVVP